MSQPRILIIEDEAVVALDIQDRLKDLGYAVAGMGERGDPPRDPAILRKLTRKCGVDFEALREAASAYQTRPLFIIELAKRRLPRSFRTC